MPFYDDYVLTEAEWLLKPVVLNRKAADLREAQAI